MTTSQLLTDPFLQMPEPDSVHVVWFTEFAGDRHFVTYGAQPEQTVAATTTQLSRVREDAKSRVGDQTTDGQVYSNPVPRNIWRHEAVVTGLSPGVRVPYRVTSVQDDGRAVRSDRFTLAPSPPAGAALKILLTSDHQQKAMTPANLQKVVETVGQVDAVFLAGDLVNIPDRASEWFDDNQGGAFFPCLQGRASYELTHDGQSTRYTGGAIIQSAPLFPAVGNHEVMGRFSTEAGLNEQFDDAYPRTAAVNLYTQSLKQPDASDSFTTDSFTTDSFTSSSFTTDERWLKNNSFNTDTYEEIFTLPVTRPGGKRYYAVSFGDVRLISLFATNIWRRPGLDAGTRGRYRERDEDLQTPEKWGYGQHIFEPIHQGSAQYNWLRAELNRPEFRQAKYKIVMFHHPPHTLGDNIVPAYTDPVQTIERSPSGQIMSVRYEYPLEADYLIRDVVPLLEAAGVQLVFYGHSHLWNRFINPNGTHFLESSNVGNTYGAFRGNQRRPVPEGFKETYAATGDPNGLEPVMPTLSALVDESGQPQPYVASNDITAFSIFDTGTGTISSYRFDTRKPDSSVVKFDEFQLKR